MDKDGEQTHPQTRRSMLIGAGILVVAALILGVLFFKQPGKVERQGVQPLRVGQAGEITTMPGKQKLATSQFAGMSYRIYPGAMTEAAKQAFTGFSLETTSLPHGSTRVTLVANKQGYRTQTYALTPGESLYFVERTRRDDSVGTDTDRMLGDDSALVVDKNGYIVPSQ